MKKKILFAAFEAAPFVKTGGLGDVAGSLPAYLKNDDFDVRVILPKLSAIPEKYRDQMRFLKDYNVPLGWRNQYCGLFQLTKDNVTYYFLDNEYYFRRDKVYGEFDDGERVAFFAKAILETVRHLPGGFRPDVIHCNDWHTALVPVFLHENYRFAEDYRDIKTVFTIHNLKFQGQYDKFVIGDVLGLDGTPAGPQMIHDDSVNYLQGAVIYADAVVTVSPTYVKEICTPQYGEGLEGLFTSRNYKLHGIINGIDRKDFNPETDKNIAANYSVKDPGAKAENKLALQRELGLKEDPDVPLFAMVSRLTDQKGAKLVKNLLGDFASKDMQLAILGTGDKEYEDAFAGMAGYMPEKFAARIAFDEGLSRRFYAGADVFVMPSYFEPCGLAQMIAMRYGTLPLVRETGGLKDTVDGYWDYGKKASGFSFKDFDENALKVTVDSAIQLWKNDRAVWKKLQKNAMNREYGWEGSAEKYRKLYESLA